MNMKQNEMGILYVTLIVLSCLSLLNYQIHSLFLDLSLIAYLSFGFVWLIFTRHSFKMIIYMFIVLSYLLIVFLINDNVSIGSILTLVASIITVLSISNTIFSAMNRNILRFASLTTIFCLFLV